MKWPWTQPEAATIGREPIYPAAPESATSVAVAEPEVEVVKESAPMPSRGPARAPSLQTEEMAEYMRVAEDIGIDCCTDLTREKLRACLTEEGIHVYNYGQVVNYLDEKLGKDWEWRGLRTADANHLGNWHTGAGGNCRKVNFADEPYRGAVPLPVLLTVQKIAKAVPEVCFYVSAPKDNDGDPFLMVTNRWLGMYVVERWDEPNFRER